MVKNDFISIKQLILGTPIFQYNGQAGFKQIRNIIEDFEIMVGNKLSASVLRNKSYFLAVELLQNAFRHGLQESNVNFVVSKSDNELLFLCDNKMYSKEKDKLKQKIEKLNSLAKETDQNAIKEYFRSILTSGRMGKGSSGVGLVELIRKTSKQILYAFSEIDEKTTNFSIIVTLPLQ